MQIIFVPPIGDRLYTHTFRFVCFCRKTYKHATHGVPSWQLTCIHAIVSRSPWGYGWVARAKGTASNERVQSLWVFA